MFLSFTGQREEENDKQKHIKVIIILRQNDPHTGRIIDFPMMI